MPTLEALQAILDILTLPTMLGMTFYFSHKLKPLESIEKNLNSINKNLKVINNCLVNIKQAIK